MKDLVVLNEAGVATTSSLKVAETFEKQHQHVLRDIDNLDCSDKFYQSNFGPVFYLGKNGEQRPMYDITKDGFTFLVMGYRGVKAAGFKEAYIKAFNYAVENANKPQLPNYPEALRQLAGSLEENEVLKIENKKIQCQVKKDKPKVSDWEKLVGSKKLYTIRQAAQSLDMPKMGQNKLFQWLRKNKVLDGKNQPYQQYTKYFKVKLRHKIHPMDVGAPTQTFINGAGVVFIKRKFQAEAQAKKVMKRSLKMQRLF